MITIEVQPALGTPAVTAKLPAEPAKTDVLSLSVMPSIDGIYTPDEEAAAAILAAVAAYLADEEQALAAALAATQASWRWQASRVLIHQRIYPIRTPSRPTWSNIERMRLDRSGVAGILGM